MDKCNPEKVTALGLALSGKILEIVSTLTFNKQKNYVTVVSALEFKYGSH